MLTIPSTVRIHLAAEPVDMRKSFDGLAAVTRLMNEDPLSGHLFVFLNRRADRVKILSWDRNGWLLIYKRLERGVFHFPRGPVAGERHVQIESVELVLMLEGIDLRGAKRRPRWAPPASESQKDSRGDLPALARRSQIGKMARHERRGNDQHR